jgi:hypothetical protein
MSRRALPFGKAVLYAALALVGCYGGMIFQGILDSVSPAIAPPALGIAAVIFLALTRAVGSRDSVGSPAANTLLQLAGAGTLAAMAEVATRLPIVAARSGADAKQFTRSLLLGLGMAAMASLLAALAARRAESFGGAPVRLAARGAVLAGAVMGLATLASPRPDRDAYLASLPVVWTTPAHGSGTDEISSELVLHRACEERACRFRLQGRAPESRSEEVTLARSERYEVRFDNYRGLWILDGGGSQLFQSRTDTSRAAFRDATLEHVAVRAADRPDALRAPRGWALLALLGAAWAATRILARRPVLRRLAEIAEAEEGLVDDAGLVALASGGPPLRASVGVQAGPALVIRPRAGPGGAYRSAAPAAERVVAGTRAENEARERLALAACDARALLVAVTTLAPLATAWILGVSW